MQRKHAGLATTKDAKGTKGGTHGGTQVSNHKGYTA